MHYCVVKGCKNKSGKSTTLKFYSFPLNNKPLLKKWLQAIPLETVSVNIHARICSEHFSDGFKSRNSVPSLFPVQAVSNTPHRKVPVKHTPAAQKRWLKPTTKIKHDHTYAASATSTTSTHETVTNPQTYLTIISSEDVLPTLST